MIVLDASVIMKWLIEEDLSEVSLLLRDNHITGKDKIAVCELLFYEIANVLSTKTHLPLKDAIDCFTYLFELELETINLGIDEFVLAINLSHKHKITVYDASYLALAQKLGCKFITADKKLFEKVKELPWVILLETVQNLGLTPRMANLL